MNFALLGHHPAAAPLIQAIFESEHHLVCQAFPEASLATAADQAFHQRLNALPTRAWEELLIDASIDAILVAGDSEEVQFAAKQLASSGKPLLLVPHVSLGEGCAYELSLIQDDSHAVLVPAFRLLGDTKLIALAERIATQPTGTVRRLLIERTITESDAPRGLTEGVIESASVEDIAVLHWLGGRYEQVTALRSGKSAGGCSQASLTLSGSNLPDATWTCRLGPTSSCRLTVETDREPITWEQPSAAAPATATITAFANAVKANAQAAPAHTPSWSDAVRVFDVLDAARRSLRRRRTIDLHFETLSERQQFKTHMTAMGCGLLMLTLVMMLALLGLGALLASRDRAVRDAEAAGLLLRETDFVAGQAALSASGLAMVDRIAERLRETQKSAYLEPASDPVDAELDQRRRQTLVAALTQQGVIAADHRTLVAPRRSAVWDTLLKILRLAWLAPLLVFLLMQGLILVARPAATSRDDRKEPS
jgi:myo-inositol 2-dehydrogenase/D-chiro-inositol 1-dehydrogenase